MTVAARRKPSATTFILRSPRRRSASAEESTPAIDSAKLGRWPDVVTTLPSSCMPPPVPPSHRGNRRIRPYHLRGRGHEMRAELAGDKPAGTGKNDGGKQRREQHQGERR